MGRPSKKGLSYFPMDVDFLCDFDIMDLVAAHGCEGTMIYLATISEVYRSGYYADVDLNRLATGIARSLGNRVSKKTVFSVWNYCASCGLLDQGLYEIGLITSAGIQRRYREVTKRNKPDTSKYWLLDEQQDEEQKPQEKPAEKNESSEALLNAPKTQDLSSKKGVSVTETRVNASKSAQNKNKNSHSKYTRTIYLSKRARGEYGNVMLSDKEYSELSSEMGISELEKRIQFLDEYIERKPDFRSNCHKLDLLRWVGTALEERRQKAAYDHQVPADHVDQVKKRLASMTAEEMDAASRKTMQEFEARMAGNYY